MSTEELQKRVARLADIEKIKNLKARYCDDNYDADGIASLFIEDGIFDGGLSRPVSEGREAVRQRLQVGPSGPKTSVHWSKGRSKGWVERQVGGHQDVASLVALAEDLEQQFRTGAGHGHEAQFVDDQQVEPRQLPLRNSAWVMVVPPGRQVTSPPNERFRPTSGASLHNGSSISPGTTTWW